MRGSQRQERYLSAKEVGAIIGLNEDTVCRLLKCGKLKGAKIGRSWRVRPSDIDRMFER
jgi:excisionase family DNA binding protein